MARRLLSFLPALVGIVATVFVVACSTPAAATGGANTFPTPVPPTALATLAPPKPAAVNEGGPSVGIENFNYVPADLTVQAGTTVVWTNHDDVEHTVTASDNTFSSPSIATDAQFSHTFTEAGTYTYFCAIHPFMTAKVIVQ